jgi:Ni/Fe-hydrogenase 1 B-type cytochrome subunit
MAVAQRARRTVYVWELPVRIVHWTIVAALVVLSVTGYYIHHPFLAGAGGPGHPGFTMGLVRFLHEATGFVFTAAVLARVYWAFAGNRYARWRALLPIT